LGPLENADKREAHCALQQGMQVIKVKFHKDEFLKEMCNNSTHQRNVRTERKKMFHSFIDNRVEDVVDGGKGMLRKRSASKALKPASRLRGKKRLRKMDGKVARNQKEMRSLQRRGGRLQPAKKERNTELERNKNIRNAGQRIPFS